MRNESTLLVRQAGVSALRPTTAPLVPATGSPIRVASTATEGESILNNPMVRVGGFSLAGAAIGGVAGFMMGGPAGALLGAVAGGLITFAGINLMVIHALRRMT